MQLEPSADQVMLVDMFARFLDAESSMERVRAALPTGFDPALWQGLTVFIVPMKAEGVTIQAVHTFQEERTNITYYDGVQVPDSYRLGEVGGGARVMAASLGVEQGMSFVLEHKQMLHSAERLCRTITRGGRT